MEALLAELSIRFPGARFSEASSWEVPPKSGEGLIPVWFWAKSENELVAQAGRLLNQFAIPLLASRTPYVVAFPFGSDRLQSGEVPVGNRFQLLSLEDLGKLLSRDALCGDLSSLDAILRALPQTPIERMLGDALHDEGLEYVPQARIGRYRADFLVNHHGRVIVVEADGLAFHDAVRDSLRDQELVAQNGVAQVIRFTGSEIWRDASACARTVVRHLKSAALPTDNSARGKLDDSQWAAVSCREAAARVLAPAGSGKTTALVRRIEVLVKHRNVPAARILVLAFNRKAASQLVDAIQERGIPVTDNYDGDSGVCCMTFNAFGFGYQRHEIEDRRRIERDPAATRGRMDGALRRSGIHLGELAAKRGSDPLGRFVRKLAAVKADLELPDGANVEIDTYRSGSNPVLPFGNVFAQYEAMQLAERVQSFDDQLYIPVRDLLEVPQHRVKLQRRFLHVLVDEYQDLSAAQLALVDILSRPDRNLFVVGDDDQLIYGWRYARLSNILRFHERMPAQPYSRTFTLSTNYRCSRPIVEASNRLIRNNENREPKDTKPGPNAPEGLVEFFASTSWDDRSGVVCSFLREEQKRSGCSWRELAVLCRFKAQQPLIALALDEAGIPRSPLLSFRLFASRPGNQLRSYIRVVLAPSTATGEDFEEVLRFPIRRVKEEHIQRICEAACPWDELQRLAQHEGEGGSRPLSELICSIRHAHDAFATDGLPVELLDKVNNTFQLLRSWTDHSGVGHDNDEADEETVFYLLRQHALRTPSIEDYLALWDRNSVSEMANHGMEDDTLDRERSTAADRVVIGTIHSAKGREYKSVAIPDYSSPELAKLGLDQQEEERRVLYVAVTRATERVLLTVDSSTVVHPYIRELVRPAEAGETLESTDQALISARGAHDAAAAEIDRLEQVRAGVKTGWTARLVQRAIDENIEAKSATASALEALRKAHEIRGIRRIWDMVTGQLRQRASQVASLEGEVRKFETAIDEDRLKLSLLLRDPYGYIRRINEDMEPLRSQVAKSTKLCRELSSRRTELRLLSYSV
jgi:DNA helicase-2/ATP-dependent DNA helicase PcrA